MNASTLVGGLTVSKAARLVADDRLFPRGRLFELLLLGTFALTACGTSAHQIDARYQGNSGQTSSPAKAPTPQAPTAPDENDAGAAEAEPMAEPVARCGDGELNGAETCDPSAADGACPEDCDDRNACTEDTLVGSAKRCNARCKHSALSGVLDDGTCCQSGRPAAESRCDAEDAGTPAPVSTPKEGPLVHRYSFDGTGNRLSDSVGDADGRLTGGSLRGDGVLAVSGIGGQYGSLPPGLISGLTSATIEVWFRLGNANSGARVFDFGSRGTGFSTEAPTYWALSPRSLLNGSPITVMNLDPNMGSSADQYALGMRMAAPFVDQYAAATFDGDRHVLTLYLNGMQAASTPNIRGALADIDDSYLWLGRPLDDSYPSFDGSILELRIYNVALSAADVDASYRRGPSAVQ